MSAPYTHFPSMKVIVLGAGIIGVSTAWFLRKHGCDVTVIERRHGAALETSYANGCQISVSFSEPWAAPDAPLQILRWLGRADAPLLFTPRFDPQQWAWGLAFLRECTPARMRRNVAAMVALARYSRDLLRSTRAETGIEYDCLERGILRFYLDPRVFAKAQPAAEAMRSLGVDRRVVARDEVIAIEPALAGIGAQIVGGDYTSDDESGDVHKFAAGLAARAAQAGVRFRYDTQATRLLSEQGRIGGVEIIAADGAYGVERADAVVVALGSFTPELLRPLGIRALIYPAKGYSATYRILDSARAPVVSLTDDSHKLVFTRLGDRLRVAGTAELSGHARALNPLRCEALTRRTRTLFPEVCDYDAPAYWAGLRPSTPSNVPLVGRTRFANLYLNAGHGTLGWTMGVGSGAVMADLVVGRRPDVDFPFLGALA